MKTSQLKARFQEIVALTKEELALTDQYFEPKLLKNKEYLLEEGKICDFIAFIDQGVIRHFHIKNGEEKTCDISFQNDFVTDFESFYHHVPSIYHFQALEETETFIVKRDQLYALYKICPKYETIGRIMAEQVAKKATEMAMSLASDKPEERYRKLLKQNPKMFQRVPQKYIANFLGISPQSLSRIRKRMITSEKS